MIEPVPVKTESERLLSLDTLRGFDMFWIVCAELIVHSLAEHTDVAFWDTMKEELTHPEWNGFTFYDLIFPLFMFISGVSFPFSLGKRKERGESVASLHRHIVTRGLILVLLGFVYNGILSLDFANARYPSVLGRIGLGYMFGSLIALHTSIRARLIICVSILLGYWAALKLIPVPGYGAGDLTPGHTISGYIDRLLIPGKLYEKVRDPEGILSTIPSIVNVLAGVMAGELLKSSSKTGNQKAGILFGIGISCWGIGKLWDFALPINKNLWTSSFAMVTIGWSLMLLAFFYLVVDVWKFRKWTLFFVVIGANPLAIYLGMQFFDFQGVAEIMTDRFNKHMHPVLRENLGFVLAWGILYYMYRKKIFIKI